MDLSNLILRRQVERCEESVSQSIFTPAGDAYTRCIQYGLKRSFCFFSFGLGVFADPACAPASPLSAGFHARTNPSSPQVNTD